MIPIIILFGIMAWVVLIYSYISDDEMLGFFASMGLLLFGVFTLINGIDIVNLNDTMTKSFAVVHIGIAVYVMLTIAYHNLWLDNANAEEE